MVLYTDRPRYGLELRTSQSTEPAGGNWVLAMARPRQAVLLLCKDNQSSSITIAPVLSSIKTMSSSAALSLALIFLTEGPSASSGWPRLSDGLAGVVISSSPSRSITPPLPLDVLLPLVGAGVATGSGGGCFLGLSGILTSSGSRMPLTGLSPRGSLLWGC